MPSLLEIQDDYAELMSFRPVGDGFELRLHETRGRRGPVTLRCAATILAGMKTDARGAVVRNERIAVRGNELKLWLHPFEIATVRLKLELAARPA
jgi:alpha-mannosidase